MKSNP
jgi:hypothetical protein